VNVPIYLTGAYQNIGTNELLYDVVQRVMDSYGVPSKNVAQDLADRGKRVDFEVSKYRNRSPYWI
jgi:hypothetical protein